MDTIGNTNRINDFLHLYLNSVDVIIESVSDEYKSHFGHAPGHKTQLGPMLWMIVFEGHVKIKPILRKLSDMTEEEKKDLVDRCFGKGASESFLDTKWRFMSIGVMAFTPETTVHLLKQGFDLFNLIPAGLAIDKTSLKK